MSDPVSVEGGGTTNDAETTETGHVLTPGTVTEANKPVAADASPKPSNGDDDEEWEYEYDDTQTEDLFINVDLSELPDLGDSSNPAQYVLREVGGRRSVYLHNRLKEFDGDGNGTQRQLQRSRDLQATAVGELQVTGLHTENPLAIYNGQLLSLQWASTLGTDLFFVRRVPDRESPHEPLRSLPLIDLLSVGSAKLKARSAQLHPDDCLFTGTQTEAAAAAYAHNGSGTGNSDVDPRPQRNTNFLARLNAAKAGRGEKTQLAVRDSHDSPGLAV